MYAKSMIEYVQARAVTGAWSRHLSFVPVALALAVAALPFTLEPQFVKPFQPSPSARAEPVAAAETPSLFEGLVQANVSTTLRRSALPLNKQQQAVAGYITRKYGVSSEVVQEFVRTAFAAGKQYGVDPLLLVAIMAVESSYNPIAESWAGAKGLMQIIPKYHPEKFEAFGGENAVFDPRVNIMVGARIVREYLLMHTGDLLAALQFYAGATADRDAVYTQRVLNEKDQLDTLAGFPKTVRSNNMVMQVDPLRPGTLIVPTPVIPQIGLAAPAASTILPLPVAPVPEAKPAEEAAHTPPTQVQLPAPLATTPVNVTLILPEGTQRF
jgi:soluble lytic murein transglycosylase-like protein